MTSVQLKKTDAGEMREILPPKDYAEVAKASEKGIFFRTGSVSPDCTIIANPFPMGNDKEDFVGLESAIRKCKRVGLFSKDE